MKRVIGPYVFEGGGAKSLNYQSLAKDLARATLEIPFNIPPYFALIARALGILEGDGSGNLRIKRMTRYEIKTGRSFFFCLDAFSSSALKQRTYFQLFLFFPLFSLPRSQMLNKGRRAQVGESRGSIGQQDLSATGAFSCGAHAVFLPLCVSGESKKTTYSKAHAEVCSASMCLKR